MRASHLACVAGVLGAGVLAAWPFRQYSPHSTPPPTATAPLDLTLRRQDVTLKASPSSDTSPAVGLDVADQEGNLKPVQPAAFSVSRPDLEDLGPPPELPMAFSPVTSRPPGVFVPRVPQVDRWLEKQMRPRQYKLRDGDTLESLAERWLGSRTRAGEIYQANREVLASPDLLPLGVTIVIPPRAAPDQLEPAM
jgi:nucleoid-associated protein YgaU